MLENDDIKRLAHLARIKVSDDEVETYKAEIDAVLGYVERVQTAAAESESSPSDRVAGPVRNVLRVDHEPHESGAYTEDLLSEAPKRKEDYVEVKKIL